MRRRTLTLAVCDVQHFTLVLARLRVGTGASRAVLVNALWAAEIGRSRHSRLCCDSG